MSDSGFVGPGVRSRGWLLLAFPTILLVVISVLQWYAAARVTRLLDQELGLRLVAVASAAIPTVTSELLLGPAVHEDDYVRGLFEAIRDDNNLIDVLLLDRDGVVLFDLDDGPLGEVHPFLPLDREAFDRSEKGDASPSKLFRARDEMLKAAYVPVHEYQDGPVGAVLCVTAGGDFHALLPELGRTTWVTGLGSGALIVLLSVLFFQVLRRFTTTDAALARAETLSAMGMMAAGVAHEIRNPLAIISGTAERLKRKYGVGGGREDELFDFIPEEVERLNGILEGYLRFARDESVTPGDCDLAQLVTRSRGMVRDAFDKSGVNVEVSGTDRAVPLRADPHRVQQVLLNLLLNAAQAMPEGGKITLALATDARRAMLRVTDTGPGFSDKALHGALQPFFTTKERGSGLGLTVARRIVEAHGGTIALANGESGGAVVTVDFPLRDVAAATEHGTAGSPA